MTNGLPWEVIGGLIGIVSFIAMIGTIAVGYGRLKANQEETKRRAERAIEKADAIADDLAAFREQAAREFVSVTTLEKVEERVVGAIDRLGDRLDRFFEKKHSKE